MKDSYYLTAENCASSYRQERGNSFRGGKRLKGSGLGRGY